MNPATKLFFTILLATVMCVASPIYDLGLPCGPNSVVGCNYGYYTTTTTTSSGNSFYFYNEPGRTIESRWSYANTNRNDYNEYAGADQFGWWQGVSGYGLMETSSSGFSDDFRYGCCSPDWWEDVFSSGSYYSLSQSGWGTSLYSDRAAITLTTFGWGEFSESWSNYYRNAGATYWPGSYWSFDNASWSGGGSGSFWNYFSQESYPAGPGGATPEPLSLLMTGGGLLSLGTLRFRKRPAVVKL